MGGGRDGDCRRGIFRPGSVCVRMGSLVARRIMARGELLRGGDGPGVSAYSGGDSVATYQGFVSDVRAGVAVSAPVFGPDGLHAESCQCARCEAGFRPSAALRREVADSILRQRARDAAAKMRAVGQQRKLLAAEEARAKQAAALAKTEREAAERRAAAAALSPWPHDLAARDIEQLKKEGKRP